MENAGFNVFVPTLGEWVPCSQKTKTVLKPSGHRVLKALPSDILGRREGKSRAESDAAMTIAVIGAYGRRVVDDDERVDYYAALRW